jgi:protein-tyrosine-phosphatase
MGSAATAWKPLIPKLIDKFEVITVDLPGHGKTPLDISHEMPKVLTTTAVEESDVVITMGCGDACPFFPGKRYLDWPLQDPAGQGVAAIRPIRDEIKGLVEDLITTL